ncbi:kinase-like domain-containing protein [Plectosphaerella plurivora]|uniref:Kinase-like domain-containing protein n=1 Tax=Plectosphaerella plurivora TaxID=936078 RepID=A0A9P8VKP8_9PEZI|nr:kinase-like domain-containing protein [Plectosphaerella plurivora]
MTPPASYQTIWEDWPPNLTPPRPNPDDVDKGSIVHESWNSRLVRVAEAFVIKYGIHVEPEEGHNMRFVAESTSIPVPKVFAIYQSLDGKKRTATYIVMEYIPGNTLQELWPELAGSRKAATAATLRAYFDELRQLKGPGHIGSNQGNPPRGDFFSVCDSSSDIVTKPFQTEDEMVECLVNIYEQETRGRLVAKVRYYRQVLADAIRCGGPFVLTHSDLQKKNIMLQPDGKVVIIDWEYACWYPAYWEYATATITAGRWDDDWHDHVRMFLDRYDNQAAWLSSMRFEMWT